jgi:diguanylate cyclase (GGDEF)-like protein
VLPLFPRRRRLTGDSRNIFALQRRIGFSMLRFLPELEARYQSSLLPTHQARYRWIVAVAELLTLLYIIVDMFSSSPALLPSMRTVLTAAMAVLAVPALLSLHPSVSAYFRKAVFVAVVLFGWTIVSLFYFNAGNGHLIPDDGVLLATIGAYFVSGLTVYEALACGVLIAAAFITVLLQFPITRPSLPYEIVFVAAANLLGIVGFYGFDYISRANFLLRHELRDLAYTDGLTDLLNRRAFYRHLQKAWRQAMREGVAIGLVVADMDNMKVTNDKYGHEEGDRSLLRLADILRDLVQRPFDAAGRLGGDEFAAIWYDVDVEWIAQRAREFEDRLVQDALEFGQRGLSVSIGVCHVHPMPGLSSYEALRTADEAMYRAKRQRKARSV